jgi:hypothetical protein
LGWLTVDQRGRRRLLPGAGTIRGKTRSTNFCPSRVDRSWLCSQVGVPAQFFVLLHRHVIAWLNFHLVAGTVALGVVAAAMALPAPAGAWGPARSGGLGHQVVLGGPGAD